MKQDPSLVMGGNIEESLKGKNPFSVTEVLKEAWKITTREIWSFLRSFILVVAVGVILLLVVAQFFGVEDITKLAPNDQLLVNLIVTVLMAPFFTALMAIALNHCVGGKSRLKHLLAFLPKAAMLALTSLLISAIIHLGLILIIPGLYLAIATGFSLLLVAEKNLHPMQAIGLSIRMVNTYWLSFIKLYLIFACLAVTIVLSSGITLVVIAPLYYHAKGVLYRDLFGINVVTRINPKEDETDESYFQA